jgi:hypothetical protein
MRGYRHAGVIALAACAGACNGSPYRDAVLHDDPAAYWRLDDPLGARFAVDETGHGHDAVIVGAVTLGADGAPGVGDGTSAMFGDQQWISAGDELGFADGSPFTLEMWVDATVIDAGHRPFLTKGDYLGYSGGYFVEMSAADDARQMPGIVTDAFPSGNGALVPFSANTWAHLAIVVDTGVLSYYLDGVLAAQASIGTWSPSTQPFTLSGASDAVHGGGCFHGYLDEVAVYDRALTADQIHAHVAAGPGP